MQPWVFIAFDRIETSHWPIDWSMISFPDEKFFKIWTIILLLSESGSMSGICLPLGQQSPRWLDYSEWPSCEKCLLLPMIPELRYHWYVFFFRVAFFPSLLLVSTPTTATRSSIATEYTRTSSRLNEDETKHVQPFAFSTITSECDDLLALRVDILRQSPSSVLTIPL